MLPPDDRHDLGAAVHDHHKQIQNITAQDAHVERLGVPTGRIVTPKNGLLIVVASQPYLRPDGYGIDDSAHTANPVFRLGCLQIRHFQNVRTDHGAVRTRVDKKL